MLPHMNFARRALASYAAIEACKITVDAECLKQIWVNMGVPDRKIEVIPFGVETDLFNTQVNGQSIRKILGIAKDDIAIISTRSFFPHYNIECLVKAAKEIVKKHSNVKFIIKGEGPLKGHIKGLVEKLDIKQYMRFIDVLPYQEIPQYLAAADIYVSTSFVDSTSVSLLEAMACGLPPITTDIAGNREWIKNGMNGLLYPPKDHVALAERISQLVEHLDLRKQFGERSNQIIMERASWENCVSRMEALYQSLT
jgi:glycosyltransferase involved in cell wall biosynthesis